MDTAGNILSAYYTPISSSLGGLQPINQHFQFLALDDVADVNQSYTFTLLLPTPHPANDLVVGLGFDDVDGGTRDVVYVIQDIQIEGNNCATADITPPVLSDVTIISNNSNPSYATTGDTVTLSWTIDDLPTSQTVTISGQSITPSCT